MISYMAINFTFYHASIDFGQDREAVNKKRKKRLSDIPIFNTRQAGTAKKKREKKKD